MRRKSCRGHISSYSVMIKELARQCKMFCSVLSAAQKWGHCITLSFRGTAGDVHAETEWQIKWAQNTGCSEYKRKKESGTVETTPSAVIIGLSVMCALSSVFTGGRVCSHRRGKAGQNPQCHPAASTSTLQVSFTAHCRSLVARRGTVWCIEREWCIKH